MTIPQWDRNRLIPPIRPDTPEEGGTQPFSRSPYEATLEEFVERFIINHDRAVLIQGFLDYRAALHHEGITRGFQWVNGSFVENVEEWQENAHTPNDIDVITYYYPPGTQNPNVAPLFWPPETKQRFHIDARGVQLGLALDEGTVGDIAYYYGLWSHRTRDQLWKGFVHIDLDPTEDNPALQILEQEVHRRGWK